MSEFLHSEILFSSDDGIPLEFNIQYAKDKASIKSLIEHGGGLCTLKEDVIHIVSPGTTVLKVSPGIKLVSTSYIYDCVKQNYLLDIDEYRFVINEIETSDISDNSQNSGKNCKDNTVKSAVDTVDRVETASPNTQTCPNSNHDFDFQESENPDNLLTNIVKDKPVTPLQPNDIRSKPETNMLEKECNEANFIGDPGGKKCKNNIVNNAVGVSDHIKTPSPNELTCPNSNHNFDFQKSENPDNLLLTNVVKDNPVTPLQPADISSKPKTNMIEKECNEENFIGDPGEQKCKNNIVNNAVDVSDHVKTPSPNVLTCPNRNHNFDFQESENPDNLLTNVVKDKSVSSLQPVDISSKPEANMIEKVCKEACINAESVESFPTSINNGERESREVFRISENDQIFNDNNQEAMEPNDLDTSAHAEIVSSSQPDDDVLDQFDKMVLRKVQENPAEKDDECLSQSDTVSSSADAQISPKAPSNTSAELFGSSNVPDSASQTTERQRYINELEKEVEKILQKPSPKSIQDKITFVKYICTVKKLAPAIVLQTLQNF